MTAENMMGEEVWNSLIPTVRYAVDFADTATATANEQVKAKLGEADAARAAGGLDLQAAAREKLQGLREQHKGQGQGADQQALAAAVAEAEALRAEVAQLKADLEAAKGAK